MSTETDLYKKGKVTTAQEKLLKSAVVSGEMKLYWRSRCADISSSLAKDGECEKIEITEKKRSSSQSRRLSVQASSLVQSAHADAVSKRCFKSSAVSVYGP